MHLTLISGLCCSRCQTAALQPHPPEQNAFRTWVRDKDRGNSSIYGGILFADNLWMRIIVLCFEIWGEIWVRYQDWQQSSAHVWASGFLDGYLIQRLSCNQDCNYQLFNFSSKWYQQLAVVALPLLIFKFYAMGGVDLMDHLYLCQ